MRSRSAGFALLLLAALLPESSPALANLETLAAACFGPLPLLPPACVFSPTDSGAGATSSILDTLTGSDGVFGRSASVTITDYDRFSATAGAGIDYSLGPPMEYPSQFFEVRGVALARFRDSLVATGATGNGLVRMRWEIEGSNSFVNDAVNPLVISDIYAETKLVAICNSGTNLTHVCTDDPLVFEEGGPADGTLTFDIPIVFGASTPYLIALELHAFSGFRSVSCDSPCIVDYHANVEADFGSTGRLVSVQLFDGSSNELSPSLIESESGFDYDIGAPEPGAPMLAAVGALVMLAARWRSASRPSAGSAPRARASARATSSSRG
jgi:hypothetical protein